MSTTVEITLTDDGKFLVGLDDDDSQPGDDSASDTDMQPAANIHEAMKMAMHLLQNPTPAGAGGAMPPTAGQGAQPGDASATASDPNAAPSGPGDSSDAKAMWDQMAQGNTPPN